MVSFQCHNCGDVVKKPKLDQHRTRCHGGFDCIDCSTTFNSPAEYKGHTSCISEAEKYQKSLYKGPRTAESAPKNNYPPQSASEPYPGGGSGWGRGGFRGGRGGFRGRGGGGGWGQASSRGTGANDTPLGTPNRRSPITQPTPVPVKEVPQPPVVEPSSNDSCNGKKRKSMGTEDTIPPNGDVPSNKKPKIDVRHVEEPASGTEEEVKKEKKSKKKSKSTNEAGEKEAVSTEAVEIEQMTKDKEKRKKKKEAAFTDDNDEPDHASKKEKSKDKKRKKEAPMEIEQRTKDKKDKKKAAPTDDNENDPDHTSKKDKEEKKRRKKEALSDAMGIEQIKEAAPTENPLDKKRRKEAVPPVVMESKKKRKKEGVVELDIQ